MRPENSADFDDSGTEEISLAQFEQGWCFHCFNLYFFDSLGHFMIHYTL